METIFIIIILVELGFIAYNLYMRYKLEQGITDLKNIVNESVKEIAKQKQIICKILDIKKESGE